MLNNRMKLTDASVGGLLASQHLTGPGGQHLVNRGNCSAKLEMSLSALQRTGGGKKKFVSLSWFEIGLQTQDLCYGLSTSLCTMQSKTE